MLAVLEQLTGDTRSRKLLLGSHRTLLSMPSVIVVRPFSVNLGALSEKVLIESYLINQYFFVEPINVIYKPWLITSRRKGGIKALIVL